MVYVAPTPADVRSAKGRQDDAMDGYQAALRALSERDREAVRAYVSAVRAEAAAYRIRARETSGR